MEIGCATQGFRPCRAKSRVIGASKLAADALGEAGRRPGNQGPDRPCGPDLGTLAAAEGRARPEGSVPLSPGEDPILICIDGKAALALLRLLDGRRPVHIPPGHRARVLPRSP